MSYRAWSELALIREVVRGGDFAALKELESRLHGCVNMVLNKYGWHRSVSPDAREDIVQESVTRLTDRIKKGFDGENLPFRSYLYKVVFTVTLMEVKRASRETSLDAECTRPDGSTGQVRDVLSAEIARRAAELAPSPVPDEGLQRQEDAGRLERALGALKSGDREMLRLFEVAKASTRAIAQQMGLTEGNVSVRLHRAKDRLCREYLRTFARTPGGIDEGRIHSRIDRLGADEAAVLRLWWTDGCSIREIATRLTVQEDRCRELFARGRAMLRRLLEEEPCAS